MSTILETGIKAAKEAGAFLFDNRDSISTVTLKKDNSFVTDIDARAEKIIVEIIKAEHPLHGIIGEEGENQSSTDEYTWIIDPIDGTHNYIRGIPLYGVSIGIIRKEKFYAGIIYMPEFSDLYTAELGQGAFKNGTQIFVSDRAEISLCTLSFDSSIRYNPILKPKVLEALGKKVFNVRMFGASTALLTLLAEGKIDISVEFDDKPWDFAAGASLLLEAGGEITDFAGNPATYKTKGYVASNGLVHEEVCETIQPILTDVKR